MRCYLFVFYRGADIFSCQTAADQKKKVMELFLTRISTEWRMDRGRKY
jgi:hypothetical protein